MMVYQMLYNRILNTNQIQKYLKSTKLKQIQRMSFLCCDCCLNIFSSNRGSKMSNKQFLTPVDDVDEEQRMTNYINKQARQLPKQYFIQQPQQNHSMQHDISVKLQLPNGQRYVQQKSPSQSNNQINETKNMQLLQMDQNQIQTTAHTQQLITQQKLKPDYSKFSINLDPYDKYYKLLHEKTQNLQKYFTFTQGKPLQFGQTKSHIKGIKLDSNKFEISYQLPCSYSFYLMLMKDSNINNKKYMTMFQKSQILQAFKPNFTRNIIRTKRLNMLEPRQFIYLKYSNGSFKQNWQICINQGQDDLISQQSTDYKRCELFSVINFKQINDKLYVRQFIIIDMKVNTMNVNMWGRIMNEVKEYLEKLYGHVESYYDKELL